MKCKNCGKEMRLVRVEDQYPGKNRFLICDTCNVTCTQYWQLLAKDLYVPFKPDWFDSDGNPLTEQSECARIEGSKEKKTKVR